MAISSSPRDYRTLTAAASLIAGPLPMAIGDLLHPEERMAPPEQVAILVDHASRWYTAHLLLFVGMMLFIPGLLALSALTRARKPAVGPAILAFFVGTAAFAIPLMRAGSRVGWAAALILLGVLLVLAEILSAQVILSQIGNILAFCGSATIAWLILRGATGETAELT